MKLPASSPRFLKTTDTFGPNVFPALAEKAEEISVAISDKDSLEQLSKELRSTTRTDISGNDGRQHSGLQPFRIADECAAKSVACVGPDVTGPCLPCATLFSAGRYITRRLFGARWKDYAAATGVSAAVSDLASDGTDITSSRSPLGKRFRSNSRPS